MTTLQVDSNAVEVSRFLKTMFRDQLPFATSLAINNTAKDVQKSQRRGMQERFEVKRQWALRGIKIRRGDWASKTDPEAIVRVGEDRDFLVKFEEGGIKDPRRGNFVPREVRRTGSGVVSRTMRIGELEFELWGRGSHGTVYRGQKRTFMILRPSGVGSVWKRKGRRRSPGPIPKRSRRDPRDGSNLELLYLIVPEAMIEDRLEFEKTATEVVHTRFNQHFQDAFDRAVITSR